MVVPFRQEQRVGKLEISGAHTHAHTNQGEIHGTPRKFINPQPWANHVLTPPGALPMRLSMMIIGSCFPGVLDSSRIHVSQENVFQVSTPLKDSKGNESLSSGLGFAEQICDSESDEIGCWRMLAL